MDSFESRRWVKSLIWVIVLLVLLPPPLMAQSMGGESASVQPFGLSPGTLSPPGATQMQGQPILTNPTALQSNIHAQTPCPIRDERTEQSGTVAMSLNDVWPTETSAMLPSSVEQRMRQERERSEGKGIPESNETPSTKALAGLGQQQAGMLAQVGAAQQRGRERPRDLSIEDAFAQFSVLQGIKNRIRQFGYDFFDMQTSGFAPVTDVPVGPDYVVGPQDTLMIHVWNVPDQQFNRSYIVPVEREGIIIVPQVGAIPVGGLTFSQAERVIRTRLASLFKRFEVHVSMARLRTMKVYVVGEVVRPGSYEISALATVSNAVYAACGPAKSGSLRQVRIVRQGQVAAELDFYTFLLTGDRNQDQRLQPGDVVFVPPLGQVAAISGSVKRPAIYELTTGARLGDLLNLAGGFTPLADQQRCHVFRLEPGRGRIIMDVDLTALSNGGENGKSRKNGSASDLVLQDGDYVRVTSLPTQVANVVSLAGAVKSPGPYEFRSGMRVKDLLTIDQLTVDAYVDRAEIVRTDPVTYRTKIIQFSPKALLDGSETENHQLQRLDQVVVTSQMRPPNLVVVEGEVKRPGYFTIEMGERLSSVLKRTGGFTPNAFPQGIVLVRESVRKRQQVELDRFMASERQRLTAESASIAAGTASIPGGGAAGMNTEQQVLSLRLQQLESVSTRVELGRVVVRMTSIEQLEGTEDDIQWEAHDRMLIPPPPQTISIIGTVKNPSTVIYRIGLGIDDYLQQAGGLTEDANRKEMYVMRANGTTESAYLKVKEMQPGDTIIVPQKIEAKTPQLMLWQNIATIIGSFALVAAGIAVIGR